VGKTPQKNRVQKAPLEKESLVRPLDIRWSSRILAYLMVLWTLREPEGAQYGDTFLPSGSRRARTERVKWGTENIIQIDEYNLYSTFNDLWLTKEERNDRIFQGIQSENLRKLRSGIIVAAAKSEEKKIKEVSKKKYKTKITIEGIANNIFPE
jgi:hypothetical protein